MNWSEHISVEQLLLVVFAAGALSMQIRGVAKAIPRIHERLDALQRWQDRRDGAAEATRQRIRTAALGVPVQEDSDA